MKLRAAVLAAVVLATSNMALAQDVEDLSETIELFRGIPQVAPYFQSAYGYAVWKRIGRGGLGIGGATGRGQVYAGGNVTGFSRLMDPLDLVEDPATGNLYVSEFQPRRMTLLRPKRGADAVSPRVFRQTVVSTPASPVPHAQAQ